MWLDEVEAGLRMNVTNHRSRRYTLLAQHLPKALRELRAIEVALTNGDDPASQRQVALSHLAGRCACAC